MQEAKIIVDMIQGELLSQAVLTLAQRADPSPHRGHMLAYREVEALNESGVDLAAKGSQHGIDGLQGAKDHAVTHPHQAPPAYGLDDLGIQELGQRHPARLGQGTCGLAPWRLDPLPI